MEFFEAVEKRRSVRKFLGKGVGEELKRILEVCNRAPSAGNLQSYRILVVRDGEKRKALSGVVGGRGSIAQAPVALVFCAEPADAVREYGKRGELYAVQDATIACAYSQLAATSLGLATVWIGSFDEEKVKDILATELRPVAMVPVGHAGEEPPRKGRKPLEELTREV